MDEIKSAKEQIRKDIAKALSSLTEKQRNEKAKAIESKLFGFANFLEARIALLYIDGENEVRTKSILKRVYDFNKIVVLPAFDPERLKVATLKVDHPDKDLIPGPRGVPEPNPPVASPSPYKKSTSPSSPALHSMRKAPASDQAMDTTTGLSRIFRPPQGRWLSPSKNKSFRRSPPNHTISTWTSSLPTSASSIKYRNENRRLPTFRG